jgi:hypothetical protein
MGLLGGSCLVLGDADVAAEEGHAPSISTADDGPHHSCEQQDPAGDLRRLVEERVFLLLPETHRQMIAQSTGATDDFIANARNAASAEAWRRDDAPDIYTSTMSLRHRQMLAHIAERRAAGLPSPATCFTPGTRDDVVAAFNDALGLTGLREQLTSRWSSTATNGGGLVQGQPTTLTYSFAPDGTFVPNLIGVTGNNNLHAFMNGIYGNEATWKAIFAQVFDRWSEVTGLTYVLEPNDDGVQLNGSPGVLGVRGDLRIAGIFIDGNSGVLAYNNFPQDGDMVLDTGDSFYTNTTGNSLRLRNVVSHEHGHGMGLLHVCPVNNTKLMEPFINLGWDGPQHDDLRGSHRHYGDPNEPDNSAATASDLGTLVVDAPLTVGGLPAPAVGFGSNLSMDADGEQDFFRFTVTAPVELTATVTPVGLTYDNSPQACGGQPGSCCSGNNLNSLAIADLNVQVLDQNGSSVLATGASAGAGNPESVSGVILSAPGDYFVRVYEGNSFSQTQLYTLTLEVNDPPFLSLSLFLPSGAPSTLAPGGPVNFDVQINPGEEVLVPGSPTLHYRYAGGAFSTAPLALVGGNLYFATLPAAECSDTPEFYVSAVGDVSGQVTQPAAGAAGPFTATVTTGLAVAFEDDFETDKGWTVSGDAADGHWQRGIPVNLNRGDPPSDHDGSGRCLLTDNDPLNSNSDVDNGVTIATSPVFDMSNGGAISYAYWLNDVPNGLLNGDSLDVEIATNAGGTNWTLLRSYTTALNSWRTDVIEVGVEVAASATMRLRFTATDLGTQNVVEAAIDAIVASSLECASTATCSDGIQNQGEDRIDCGGPCAPCACVSNAVCDDGLYCNGGGDCDAFGECQLTGPPCAGQSCREADQACIAFGGGDFDADGDIDLHDFAGVQQCFGGEAFSVCERVNLAGGAMVDEADVAEFVPLIDGPQ